LLGDSLLETAEIPAKREVEAKIDIVKSVFTIKKIEMENAQKALANKAQKEKILAIIENKQDQELSEKSIEELRKIYDNLD
jgi:hemolysin activation/secretion protein